MKRRRKKTTARKFRKRRIKISVLPFTHAKMLLQIQPCDTIWILYIIKKRTTRLRMCTKGYSHIIRTDKSQPSSATPKKKRMKEQHLAMREEGPKKEQSGQKKKSNGV